MIKIITANLRHQTDNHFKLRTVTPLGNFNKTSLPVLRVSIGTSLKEIRTSFSRLSSVYCP